MNFPEQSNFPSHSPPLTLLVEEDLLARPDSHDPGLAGLEDRAMLDGDPVSRVHRALESKHLLERDRGEREKVKCRVGGVDRVRLRLMKRERK